MTRSAHATASATVANPLVMATRSASASCFCPGSMWLLGSELRAFSSSDFAVMSTTQIQGLSSTQIGALPAGLFQSLSTSARRMGLCRIPKAFQLVRG